MIVFIGMETSGALRRRFQAAGHYVISCDVLPAEDGADFTFEQGGHIVGDVYETLEALEEAGIIPDLAIFHPTCTYLTNSAAWAFKDPDFERYPGVGYHQKVKPTTLTGAARREARAEALDGIRHIMKLKIARKVVENPVGAINTAIRKASQILQPYEHGDDASKGTCLWFFGADGEPLSDMQIPLDPAKRVTGRMVNRNGRMIECWSNQTDGGQNKLTPGEERWKDRSRTFDGIADAMADAWGALPPPARNLI